MAQEIWFRSDLKHIIEGLALSFAHSQALSGAAQAISYQHGFLSALASIGSCLGITDLHASLADQFASTTGLGIQVTGADFSMLVTTRSPAPGDLSHESTGRQMLSCGTR